MRAIYGHWDTESYFSNLEVLDQEEYDKYTSVFSKVNRYSNRNGAIINNSFDPMRDISRSVLGARLADIVLNDDSISDKEKEEYAENYRINQMLELQAKEVLFDGLPSMTIKAVSDNWHLRASKLKIQKEKDYGGITWQPIFGKEEIDIPKNISGEEGWKLVTLTNTEQLRKEGKDLDHCVGGYTDDCNNGNSHIISIRSPHSDTEKHPNGKPVSTIEIKTDYSTGSFSVAQHYGHKNSEPERQSKSIEKEIIKKLNTKKTDKESPFAKLARSTRKFFTKSKNNSENSNPDWDSLTIDYDSLGQAREERKKLVNSTREKLKSKLGFDPLDEKKRSKVQKVYSGVVAPKNSSVKDADGNEIENFSSELRSKLRKRFQKLLTMEIDISPEQIGGKSAFSSPELETETTGKTKTRRNFSDEYVKNSAQSTLDNIFTEYEPGYLKVGIDKTSGTDNKKKNFGEISVAIPEAEQVDSIKEKLEGIFQNESKIEIQKSKDDKSSYLKIHGMTPKPVLQLLEGYERKHGQGTVMQL